MSLRTYRRWTRDGKIQADRRSEAQRPVPQNKLIEQERQAILDAANEPSYANLHPSQKCRHCSMKSFTLDQNPASTVF
jgi:putative transposase